MLNVEDVCSEADVLTRDSTVLTAFGDTPLDVSALLADKRSLAVMSWLALSLEKAGYSPIRHSARRAPDRAYGYTGAAWSDLTNSLDDKEGSLDLTTVLNTPSSDLLYLGYSEPFRALWVSMADAVNISTLSVSSLSFWNGAWTPFDAAIDGTMRTSSLAFSGSGRLSWRLPTDWEKRPLNAETTWRFWIRLGLNRRPQSATLTHMLPVRTSRFTTPCVHYALGLLYQENWGGQRGEWKDKGEAFLKRASDTLVETLALPNIADEFLLDDAESIAKTDINSVTPQTASDLTSWQRG